MAYIGLITAFFATNHGGAEFTELREAAFKSAQEDGMSRDGAINVAWNSIKQGYEQGGDGKWHRRPQDSNAHHKSITTGGN